MNKFSKLLGFDPVEKQTSVRTELVAALFAIYFFVPVTLF